VNIRNNWRGNTADILRYSISLDKIWKVSELKSRTYGGLAVPSKDRKSIYYFGGVSSYNTIQKFNSETNYTSQIGTTNPYSILHASGLSMNDGTILIHNGRYGSNVLEYDELSEQVKVIVDLPFQSSNALVFSNTAIPYGEDGGVWLFAGNNPKPKNPILHFNTTTKTVSIPGPSSNVSYMPTLYEYPAAVTDGRYGYLIGGIGRVPEKDGYYHPSNGILRYV
jgi:N-acetylneuraminic acid mutarotase